MKPSRARLTSRLSLTHRNQWATIQLRETQEKARLYTDYRPKYAQLTTEAQRARLLQQFTRDFQHLTNFHQRRRNRLVRQQRRENGHFTFTAYAPRPFAYARLS